MSMEVTSRDFPDLAHDALEDKQLRQALGRLQFGLAAMRGGAIARLPEFERLRDEGKAIRDHTLAHLDVYLERFTEQVEASGGVVHFAPDAESAREIILGICRSVGAKKVTKGKSMVTEEIELNEALEAAGLDVVETDLGEFIVQLAGDRPSHIIAPVLHKTRFEIGELFAAELDVPYTDDPTELNAIARRHLRTIFLGADLGISGVNFAIAESGSVCLVTNEGNGRLTTTAPRTHIAVMGMERIVPTFADLGVMLEVLARSGTGQRLSVYTNIVTGPRRDGDLDGPEEFHVILLDNGRSAMLGTEVQEMLRCIRCGACMNHCPVYQSVGGHTYGAVYVGPMGSVLSPSLFGVPEMRHLPNASTFCGRCESVCPMQIPLPKLMRHWRERAFEQGAVPATERWGLGVWAFFARRGWLYRPLSRLATRVLGRLGRGSGRISRLPLAGAWTDGRDLPAPQGRTFQERWRQQQRRARRT